MDAPLPVPWPALAFVLGALVGSFLNVVVARVPAGESIIWPGSRCPTCRTPIPPHLNVPILSWLWLRGRCRHCKTRIPARYPMVELLTAALFTACAVRFGFSAGAWLAMAFAAALVAVTFVDIDIWEIPDEISLPGIAVGVLLAPPAFAMPWWAGAAGATLGAASLLSVRWIYQLLRGQEGMGLGDVKLIAMIGAFVGPAGLLPTILVASLSGTVIGALVLWLGPSGPTEGDTDGQADGQADGAPPEAEIERRPSAEVGVPKAASDDSDAAGSDGAREPSNAGSEPNEHSVPSPPPSETSPTLGSAEKRSETTAGPEEDEDDWEPPENAVPFGPFLALGGLTQLLMGPVVLRLLQLGP